MAAWQSSDEKHLVVFDLAGETYGVPISAVNEIGEMRRVTAVPGAPGFIEGIINLRGAVIPVIDLRKQFGLQCAGLGKNSRIIVIEVQGHTLGAIVDQVTEVLRVKPTEIEPPSPIIIGPGSRFIEGVAKVGDRLIIVVDLTKLLSAEEAGDLDKAT